MLVVIAGSGTVGKFILDQFTAEHASITIIENDARKCDALKQQYDAQIIEGDLLSHYVLRHANVAAAELFIACSNSDAMNILSCQLAKRLGAQHCVARVYSEDIFPFDVEALETHLGIDWLVSPSRLAGDKLYSTLFESENVLLDSYFASKLQIARLVVTSQCGLYKKKLHKFFKSKKLQVIALYRAGENILPQVKLSEDPLLQNSDGSPIIFNEADVLIVTGVDNKLSECIGELYVKDIKGESQKLYIASSSKPIMSLLYFLGKRRRETVVLENDLTKANAIKRRFKELTVINVNPAQHSLLKLEKLDVRGVFICGGEDDADNLTYALNAEELGFTRIIPIVHGISQRRFFNRIHCEQNICPSELAAQEIFRYFDENIKKEFELIHNTTAKAITREIESNSPWFDKPLSAIDAFDNDIRPIATWRKGHVYLPHDESLGILQEDDRILITSLSGNKIALRKLLGA